MKRSADNFQKQPHANWDPQWVFRARAFVNLTAHLLFGTLFAFEHTSQVYSHAEADYESAAAGLAQPIAVGPEVITPASNFLVMGLNLALAVLVLVIAGNVDAQIAHIQAPTFMPARAKPTYRYRYLYWAFSFLTVFVIMLKDRGDSVVSHGWFVLLAVCTLLYAPFWLS